MIGFIDEHREAYGVEPICRVLPIAPSTYHKHLAQRHDPSRLSKRAMQDLALKPEIARVFAENFAVYGVRTAMNRAPIVGRLLERIQDEAGVCCPVGAPADDPPGVVSTTKAT